MSPQPPIVQARKLKLVLPKGRLQEKVMALLSAVGVDLAFSSRSYRPLCSDPDIEVKLLKPQNIPSMVALGRHDAGFAGHDWVLENGLEGSDNLVELLDLLYDKVRLIAAVPDHLAVGDQWRKMKLVVASEYTTIAKKYIDAQKLDAVLIKSYGATEALPPEDADLIVDNTSTGSTLQVNRLTIVDTILHSTTRFMASGEAMADGWKKEKLSQMVMLMQSKLNAAQKVLLEMNVSKDDLDKLVAGLPAMRSPTVSPLYGNDGFAVKVAVPTKEVSKLIPQLIALGAKDVLEYRLEKIIL